MQLNACARSQHHIGKVPQLAAQYRQRFPNEPQTAWKRVC